jgi:hypothetical protein
MHKIWSPCIPYTSQGLEKIGMKFLNFSNVKLGILLVISIIEKD